MTTYITKTPYTNRVVTITIPKFGYIPLQTFLDSLAHTPSTLVTCPVIPEKRGQPSFVHQQSTVEVQYTFRYNQVHMVQRFLDGLANIFKSGFLSYIVTEEPAFKDDWELLTHLLKTMNWLYPMSDDYRYWAAGEAQQQEINNLSEKLKTIDPIRFATLYKKESPPVAS